MTRHLLKFSALALGASLLGSIAPAAYSQQSEPVPHVMPETEVWDMTAAHGDVYRIYVSKPGGEAPEGGYPVLYVLDGNAIFEGFATGRRIQSVYDYGMDQMIVVGVGYPNQQLYEGRRVGDFTPPIRTPFIAEHHKNDPTGRQDLFEAFLMDELRPAIANRYSVNPLRESLYGHSLGGIFALHIFYTQPGAFHAIISASPAIWWDNQLIVDEERAFAERLTTDPEAAKGTRLLLLIGEDEEMQAMPTDMIALAHRLQDLSKYGLRSSYEIFEDEIHITVPIRSITPTLRFAMQWP